MGLALRSEWSDDDETMKTNVSLLAVVVVLLAGLSATAHAQEPGTPEGERANPTTPPPPQTMAQPSTPPEPEKDKKPRRGDFDAGGQVRLPSGPDEMGKYATFNWIAVDVKGRYFLLDSVTVNGNIPLAVVKPGKLMNADGSSTEPSVFGGMMLTLDARLPRLPFQPSASQTEVGLVLSGAYMREGAMLLSEKDFPLFIGDFQLGYTAGLYTKLKLSSLVDFSLVPVFVYQSASAGSLTALQVPTSLILRLGSLLVLTADVGIFTGDDFSLRGKNGGRIALGGSISIKIGPILFHAGAGAASLLTGGLYPGIGDSLYVDLNVKYVK